MGPQPTIIGDSSTWVSLERTGNHEMGSIARVTFLVGSLAGELSAVVAYAHSIAKDLEVLDQKAPSEMQLATLDAELILDMKRSLLGAVDVEALIRSHSPEYELKFRYAIDQTYLRAIASSFRKNFC